MNKHGIYRELFNLPKEELWAMHELTDVISEARMDFARVDVEFTHEAFVKYLERLYNEYAKNSSGYPNRYEKMLKIAKGDNLDAIEDAAKDKGLL